MKTKISEFLMLPRLAKSGAIMQGLTRKVRKIALQRNAPMQEAEDPLMSFEVQLGRPQAALGFAPIAIVVVYDNPDCNAVVCCVYRDQHYHIPYPRPEGQLSSFVAKKLRDDSAWANSFLNDQLQKLVKASSTERLFMEVPDNEVRIN